MRAAMMGARAIAVVCCRRNRPPDSFFPGDISADWQPDPALNTEIEVRFIADGNDAMLVEFEHRRLDLYGARRDEIAARFRYGRRLGTSARGVRRGRKEFGHLEQ